MQEETRKDGEESERSQDTLVEPDQSLDASLISELEDPLLKALADVAPPSPMPRLGEWIAGRYEIKEKLGEGAMGLVLKAEDHELPRWVALKFILPHNGLGAEELGALRQQEAAAIAHLQHENIVRIYDVAEWGRQPFPGKVPYLIMEWLEGESLQALLQREQRLELPRALELMRGITAGLAHAHARHIVHCDLKPSNVFIDTEGRIKLLDFGLAQFTRDITPAEVVKRAHLGGTPLYMAPEQWRGEPPDVRTDIWGAGMLLFELLVGQPPYRMNPSQKLRERILSAERMPSLHDRRPDLPREVSRILARALAKEPSRRFQSVLEFRERLLRLEKHPRTVPEQRLVTLVCCLLSGSADCVTDAEPVFQQLCSKLIESHGGTFVERAGDVVLACFGYPIAREYSAQCAVRAGLHLAEALREELSRQDCGGLSVRLSVHTAMVTVTTGAREDLPIFTGEGLRVTRWLAEQAEPNTTVLSHDTHALVRGSFETSECGTRVYTRLSTRQTVELHCLLREKRVRDKFDARDTNRLTPLFGRGAELELLRGCWEQTRRQRGRGVLISGEAGIGKSRLLEELRSQVLRESNRCLRFQCWPQSSSSAFAPIIDMLHRALNLEREDAPATRWRLLREFLEVHGASLDIPVTEQLLLLGALLTLPPAEGLPPLELTPKQQKEKTLRVLVGLALNLAEQRPLLVIVEDLHWIDPSSLELLGLLLDRLEGSCICVLLSTRPDYQPPWSEHPALHRLELGRLPAECMSMLMGEVAGTMLPEQLVQQLVERAEGIPLFAEELTHMVLTRMRTGGDVPNVLPDSVPVALQELLRERLDQLPPRQLELVRLGAVIGRHFSRTWLLALLGREDAVLTRDLEELVDAGVLQQQDDEPEPTYAFRHALIQEAAHDSLPPKPKRQHHAKIARFLTTRFPEVIDSQPEVLAHHYTASGELEEALRHWVRAGERAVQRSAHQEAICHLTRALEVFEQLPDASSRRRQELQLLLALSTSLTVTHGYGPPEVERLYERIRHLLPGLQGVPEVGTALAGMFLNRFGQGRLQEAREVAGQLARLGEDQQSPELLVTGHRMLATVLFTQGELGQGLEHSSRAVENSRFMDLQRHRELARKLGLDPTVAALTYASIICSVSGRLSRARMLSAEALRLAERIAHPSTLAFTFAYTATSCELRREDARFILERAQQGIELSTAQHFPMWLGWSTMLWGWAKSELAGSQQERSEGCDVLKAGLERWRAAGMTAGWPYFLGLLASVLLKLGQLQEGLKAVENGLDWVRRTGERSSEAELHRLQGELHWEAGSWSEAQSSLVRAIAVARQQGARTFELRAAVSQGRQLLALGRREAARRLVESSSSGFEGVPLMADLAEARELLERIATLEADPPAHQR